MLEDHESVELNKGGEDLGVLAHLFPAICRESK